MPTQIWGPRFAKVKIYNHSEAPPTPRLHPLEASPTVWSHFNTYTEQVVCFVIGMYHWRGLLHGSRNVWFPIINCCWYEWKKTITWIEYPMTQVFTRAHIGPLYTSKEHIKGTHPSRWFFATGNIKVNKAINLNSVILVTNYSFFGIELICIGTYIFLP